MLPASCCGREVGPVVHAAAAPPPPELRRATDGDLCTINAVIERAVTTWKLPARVKSLAMTSYRYTEYDLTHLHIVVADDRTVGIVGVAAWEPAATHDCPLGRRGLQLHGIYVDPDRQRRGVGAGLLSAAATAARQRGFDGILVKAQADAVGFFGRQGLQKLPVLHADRDYAHRFWLDLAQQQGGGVCADAGPGR